MVGPPVAIPWMRLAPLVRLWLTGWLFQGGFVGSSSGFVGSSKWLHRADVRTPSPLWKKPAQELIGGVRWSRRCHPATKELRFGRPMSFGVPSAFDAVDGSSTGTRVPW